MLVLGDADDVDVVRHQAPAENTQTVTRTLMLQERHVEAPVEVAEENLLAVVPPLRDVVRWAPFGPPLGPLWALGVPIGLVNAASRLRL